MTTDRLRRRIMGKSSGMIHMESFKNLNNALDALDNTQKAFNKAVQDQLQSFWTSLVVFLVNFEASGDSMGPMLQVQRLYPRCFLRSPRAGSWYQFRTHKACLGS